MGNHCGRTRELKTYNPMLEPYSERIHYRKVSVEVPVIAQFWRKVLARADLPGICPSQLEKIGKNIYEKASNSACPHISMTEFIRMCAINHLVWFSDSELERFVSSTCLEFFQSDIQDKYAKETLMEITSLLAKCVPRSPVGSDNDAVMIPMESPSVKSMSLFSTSIKDISGIPLPNSSPGSSEGQVTSHFVFPKLEGEAAASKSDLFSVGSSVMAMSSSVECFQVHSGESEGRSQPIKAEFVLRSKCTTSFSLGDIPSCIYKGSVFYK